MPDQRVCCSNGAVLQRMTSRHSTPQQTLAPQTVIETSEPIRKLSSRIKLTDEFDVRGRA